MPSVEVIIKSSRRPWALDRLLRSLERFLVSRDPLKISCVDDRTEPRFIEELMRRYPDVDFSKKASWVGKEDGGMTLPYVEAWQQAVAQSEADYVLVLEDDQWICETLDLDECSRFMASTGAWSLILNKEPKRFEGVSLFGSKDLGYGFYLPVNLERSLAESIPLTRLFLNFITSDRFVIQKIHGLVSVLAPRATKKHWQSIAKINPMCGAIFLKSYWSILWSGRITRINENIMIGRSLRLLRSDPEPRQKLAIGSKTLFETTFLSSVSLTLGTEVDWDRFNLAWSEAWIEGRLNSYEGSSDWDFAALQGIIQSDLGVAEAEAYLKWSTKFAAMHSR